MQAAKGIRRSSEEAKTARPEIKVLLIMLLASAIFVTGCGGDEKAQDDSAEEQTESTEARTEARGERTGGERSGEVALEIEGDPGTAFSGVCSVGDEEEEIEGEVPESFAYDLKGQQLECEIQKQGTDAGNLRVVLTAPGNNIVQQTSTPGGTINLTFSGNGVSSSSSTSSSTSSSSVNQVNSSSSVNQVVSSSSSNSSP